MSKKGEKQGKKGKVQGEGEEKGKKQRRKVQVLPPQKKFKSCPIRHDSSMFNKKYVVE